MYLGIDIGTSSVKAVIVDDKDTVVEQASAALSVSFTAASLSSGSDTAGLPQRRPAPPAGPAGPL